MESTWDIVLPQTMIATVEDLYIKSGVYTNIKFQQVGTMKVPTPATVPLSLRSGDRQWDHNENWPESLLRESTCYKGIIYKQLATHIKCKVPT